MPKVSIILTSYNHEKYIAAAIESVLKQTFSDFELLIFDDGSTDNSHEIIKSFTDSRIKLFLNKENTGAVQMLQAGVKISSGEFIAIHHSDDIWEPDKLEKQVKFLEKNPEYIACFTQVKFIDEHGEIYELPEDHHYKKVFKQKNRSREEWLNHLFWKANCFCHPSILARNCPQYFFHNPALFQLPDYFTWVKLRQKKNVYVMEEELTLFRIRRGVQNSVSSLSLEKLIRLNNEEYFIAKEFMQILHDENFFLKVFPESQKFLINGEINIKFAFAQLCIEKKIPAYQKLALERLYELIHNDTDRKQIKKLYNYDEKSLIGDSGEFDVFGIASQVPTLKFRFFPDFGANFPKDEVFSKNVLIREEGNFSFNFSFKIDKDIECLRFSPTENTNIAFKILKLSVNDELTQDFISNAFQIENDFFYFTSGIPLFEINKKIPAGKIDIQIVGVVKNALPPIVEKFKSILLSDNSKNTAIKNFKKKILRHIL